MPDIYAGQNAFNNSANPSYQLQSNDIHYIGNQLIQDTGSQGITFIGAVGEGHHAKHLSVSAHIKHYARALEGSRRLVGVYNAGGHHWVSFMMLADNARNRLIVLYKDSFGHPPSAQFTQTVKQALPGYEPDVISNTGTEQSDGTSCGLFALKNIELMSSVPAEGLGAFVTNFATQPLYSPGTGEIYSITLMALRRDFAKKYAHYIYHNDLRDVLREKALRQRVSEVRQAEADALKLLIANHSKASLGVCEARTLPDDPTKCVYILRCASAVSTQIGNTLDTLGITYEIDKAREPIIFRVNIDEIPRAVAGNIHTMAKDNRGLIPKLEKIEIAQTELNKNFIQALNFNSGELDSTLSTALTAEYRVPETLIKSARRSTVAASEYDREQRGNRDPHTTRDRHAAHNAFNRYDDISYQLQTNDIHYIGNQLIQDIGSPQGVVFIGAIGEGRGAQYLNADAHIKNYATELENNNRLIGVHNAGGNHWVSFMMLAGDTANKLTVLYKDSFGEPPSPQFTKMIEQALPRYALNVLSNDGKEQSDGSSCGLFALKNMEIMSRIPTASLGDFVRAFEKKAFYSPKAEKDGEDALLTLRRDFAKKYACYLYNHDLPPLLRDREFRQTISEIRQCEAEELVNILLLHPKLKKADIISCEVRTLYDNPRRYIYWVRVARASAKMVAAVLKALKIKCAGEVTAEQVIFKINIRSISDSALTEKLRTVAEANNQRIPPKSKIIINKKDLLKEFLQALNFQGKITFPDELATSPLTAEAVEAALAGAKADISFSSATGKPLNHDLESSLFTKENDQVFTSSEFTLRVNNFPLLLDKNRYIRVIKFPQDEAEYQKIRVESTQPGYDRRGTIRLPTALLGTSTWYHLPNLVIMTGQNGSGKTQLLDFIYDLLGDSTNEQILQVQADYNPSKEDLWDSREAPGSNNTQLYRVRTQNISSPQAMLSNIFTTYKKRVERFPEHPSVTPWEAINRIIENNKVIGKFEYRIRVFDPQYRPHEWGLVDSQGKRINFDDLSAGQALILTAIVWQYIISARNIDNQIKYVLLDEPDRHFDPELSRLFLHIIDNVFLSRGIQVFLTTHRIDTIALVPTAKLITEGEHGSTDLLSNTSCGIYTIKDKQICPTTKLHAMFSLTNNLRELTNLHFKVYVESTNDARFYEGVYHSLLSYCDEVKKEAKGEDKYTWRFDKDKAYRLLSKRYQQAFHSVSKENAAGGGGIAVKLSMQRDITAIDNLSTQGGMTPLRWRITKKLIHHPELYKTYGILDNDYGKDYKLREDGLEGRAKVLGRRHSLDNFIFDPFIFCSVLTKEEIKECIEHSWIAYNKPNDAQKKKNEQQLISACLRIKDELNNKQCRVLQDQLEIYFRVILGQVHNHYHYEKQVKAKAETKIKTKAKTKAKAKAKAKAEAEAKAEGEDGASTYESLTKKIAEKVELCDQDQEVMVILDAKKIVTVRYPKEFLEIRGHDIEKRCFGENNAFNAVKAIIERVYQQGVACIPVDLAEVFFDLNDKLRANVNAAVKPDLQKVIHESALAAFKKVKTKEDLRDIKILLLGINISYGVVDENGNSMLHYLSAYATFHSMLLNVPTADLVRLMTTANKKGTTPLKVFLSTLNRDDPQTLTLLTVLASDNNTKAKIEKLEKEKLKTKNRAIKKR